MAYPALSEPVVPLDQADKLQQTAIEMWATRYDLSLTTAWWNLERQPRDVVERALREAASILDLKDHALETELAMLGLGIAAATARQAPYTGNVDVMSEDELVGQLRQMAMDRTLMAEWFGRGHDHRHWAKVRHYQIQEAIKRSFGKWVLIEKYIGGYDGGQYFVSIDGD